MLKNVLSLLLSKFYSKQESELVGHQAMPSSQSISITPTVNSVGDEVATVATFNAQADGFVIVRATTDGAPPSRLILSSYVSTYIFNNSAGGTIATFIPIAKGIQCTVQGRNLKNIAISLDKTIGGGYQTLKNALLQGGGLCLSHWYSSLQRNSYRTSGSGWLISQQFLFKALLNYLLLQMEKVTHSRCRTRGLSTSEVMEFGLPILEGSISSISDHLRMGIFRSGLTLKKVKNLPTQLGNQISSLLPIFEYTKSRGTIDQMFGGASC